MPSGRIIPPVFTASGRLEHVWAWSLLILERVPRPADLTEADRTPIAAGQHALYFRSVPGKQYGVQWADAVDGPWNATAVVTASTTQKRLVFDRPATHAFYRVILAQ